jgi:hypothetical protein
MSDITRKYTVEEIKAVLRKSVLNYKINYEIFKSIIFTPTS